MIVLVLYLLGWPLGSWPSGSGLAEGRAREHVVAAHAAALLTDTDPALLLAIAYYESRYSQHVITREPLGKVSCGVMTPVPTYSTIECAKARASLLSGYLIGAAHLRQWQDRCLAIGQGGPRCTLLSYAGGGLLRRYCAESWRPVCNRAFTLRLRRAAWIRRLLYSKREV